MRPVVSGECTMSPQICIATSNGITLHFLCRALNRGNLPTTQCWDSTDGIDADEEDGADSAEDGSIGDGVGAAEAGPFDGADRVAVLGRGAAGAALGKDDIRGGVVRRRVVEEDLRAEVEGAICGKGVLPVGGGKPDTAVDGPGHIEREVGVWVRRADPHGPGGASQTQ